MKPAFALVRRVTEEKPWEEIARRREEDLLVYLALSRFQRRPKVSQLPPSIQRDIKEFLGGYRTACARADVLLFRAGDPAAIDAACQQAEVGQLVDNALIIHRSALDHLQPILCIYEGCARALIGDVDEAILIKLHRFSGKVSYLAYPDFEQNGHPALRFIEDSRAVFITYQSQRATEPVTYDVYPYGITTYFGTLYLIGHHTDADEIRTWKVDRIEDAEATEVRFQRPKDFELARFLDG